MKKSLSNIGKGWEFCYLPKDEYPKIGAKNWNPITGCARLHHDETGTVKSDCKTPDGDSYCYMSDLCNRFHKIHSPAYGFHEDRLEQPLNTKKPSIVAVGTSGDMWYGANYFAIAEISKIIKKGKQHFYLFLTKNPENYRIVDAPNVGYGATVTSAKDLWRIKDLQMISGCNKDVPNDWKYPVMTWVIIEPCFFTPAEQIDFTGIDWVIVGALTGQGAKKWMPETRTIRNIEKQVRKSNAAFYIKNSLKTYDTTIKEFPPQIHAWAKAVA